MYRFTPLHIEPHRAIRLRAPVVSDRCRHIDQVTDVWLCRDEREVCYIQIEWVYMECAILHIVSCISPEADGVMEVSSTIAPDLYYLIVRIDHSRYQMASACHIHIPSPEDGLCFANSQIYVIDRSDSGKPLSTSSGKIGAINKECDAHVSAHMRYVAVAYSCSYIDTLASSYILLRLNTHTLNKEVIPSFHP